MKLFFRVKRFFIEYIVNYPGLIAHPVHNFLGGIRLKLCTVVVYPQDGD